MKFPKEGKFSTKEEIDEYFAGDKIQCLLCGKRLRYLTHTHLEKHNITADEYKTLFGLPYGRGLFILETKEKKAENMKRTIENGQIDIMQAVRKAVDKRHSGGFRVARYQAFARKSAGERIKNAPHDKGLEAMRRFKEEATGQKIQTTCGRCGKETIGNKMYVLSHPKTYCNPCRRAIKAEYRAKHREKHNIYLKEYRAKKKFLRRQP